MKYKVEVGSFCTRFVQRTIIVTANREEDAIRKAIDKFKDKEMRLNCYSDFGKPQADFVEEV